MNEFVSVCLGLGMTGRKVDEICDNFGIDISDENIYEALGACPRDDYRSFGNILISDLYAQVVSEWAEQLDEEKFDWYVNGDDSHLYYDGEEVWSCDDLQEILDKLEEENEEEEE